MEKIYIVVSKQNAMDDSEEELKSRMLVETVTVKALLTSFQTKM